MMQLQSTREQPRVCFFLHKCPAPALMHLPSSNPGSTAPPCPHTSTRPIHTCHRQDSAKAICGTRKREIELSHQAGMLMGIAGSLLSSFEASEPMHLCNVLLVMLLSGDLNAQLLPRGYEYHEYQSYCGVYIALENRSHPTHRHWLVFQGNILVISNLSVAFDIADGVGWGAAAGVALSMVKMCTQPGGSCDAAVWSHRAGKTKTLLHAALSLLHHL